MKPNIKSYFSPFFLSRSYLRRDIEYALSRYTIKGTVLDVGCGSKPYQYLFNQNKHISQYYGIDFTLFSINKDYALGRPDYFFPKNYRSSYQLPFKDNQFDNTVSFQVLEHHQDPSKMLSEMVRITKKGGYIMISFPLIWSLHEVPNDYYRFTQFAITALLKQNNCKIVEIIKEGSIFSAISMLLNEEINRIASINRFYYIIAFVLYIPLLLFQFFSAILDQLYKSPITFPNYLIIARTI